MWQEFTQELEKTARAVVNEIHTALPGEIVSFDAKTGLSVVQPIGKYVTFDGKALDYPKITEVPLVFPICQQVQIGIAFPVKEGDSCIIIVSEVELDEWRSSAESEGSLRYDLTSAVAIPGLMKSGGTLLSEAVDNMAVIIGTNGSKILVSESGIIARGNLKVEGNISYTGEIAKV